MDQQRTLEAAALALKEEQIKSGTVSPDGVIKGYAANSYKSGLVPADVANYAALTEGVSIPKETINSLAQLQKPEEKKPEAAASNALQTAPKPVAP